MLTLRAVPLLAIERHTASPLRISWSPFAQRAITTSLLPSGRRTQKQPRSRRGSRREELLNLVREGNGLSRGEILERMDLKGDKSSETSVSNALSALIKRNQVRREDGKYYPGSPEAGEAELPLDATDGDQTSEAGAKYLRTDDRHISGDAERQK